MSEDEIRQSMQRKKNESGDPNGENDSLARYQRQFQYPPIAEAGQNALCNSRVLICGCGALGSVSANTLARAGVGFLRVVDRDFLELNNLQRQVLYDEKDVEDFLPKAIAASNRLSKINSDIQIEPVVKDIDSQSIEFLARDVDLIIDGTDNFETRFLINDLSVKTGIPWIYGGCIGADGQTMTILPEETACLNCLMLDGPPPPGTTATCDSAGILSTIINVIASIQATEAIKILSGNRSAISRNLTAFELWDNRIRQIKLDKLRESVDCPTCKQKKFQWLDGHRGGQSAVLCGRNAVQLSFDHHSELSLEALETKLAQVGAVQRTPFMLRFMTGKYTLTVFPDARAIVSGTEEISEAKTVYARYIGN